MAGDDLHPKASGKAEAPANITPLLMALAGGTAHDPGEDAHDHAPGEGCPSDAMLRLVP